MSQVLFTQSIEAATITLTNTTSSSDAKRLKNRDNRQLGINEATGTTTIQIEFDYGTSTTADSVILGVPYSTESITWKIQRWNGSAYVQHASASRTFDRNSEYLGFTSDSATKWRLDFERATTTVFELGPIFFGERYNLPVNYQLENNEDTFLYGEIENDSHGYNYSNIISSSGKEAWDVVYKLSRTQLNDLKSELEHCNYEYKRFYFQDTIRNSTKYYLCKLNQRGLPRRQISADLLEVPIRIVEV